MLVAPGGIRTHAELYGLLLSEQTTLLSNDRGGHETAKGELAILADSGLEANGNSGAQADIRSWIVSGQFSDLEGFRDHAPRRRADRRELLNFG